MEQTKAPIEHSLICGGPKPGTIGWSGYHAPPERPSWYTVFWLYGNTALMSAVGALGLVYVTEVSMLAGAALAMVGFGSLGVFLKFVYEVLTDD